MIKESFWYPSKDGTCLFTRVWKPNLYPKAIIQIAHGMMEHGERYDEFASHLALKGFIVYINDHRGHGKTGERQGQLGFFADSDGFMKTVDDLTQLSKRIKIAFPELPLYLIGHSMGSFLIRIYLQTNSHLANAAILSGTGYFPFVKTLAGKWFASFLPSRKESPLMNKLVFGTYNKKIPHSPTGFEWLSRNESTIKNYMKDPYTGFTPTGRFFYDLMNGLIAMQKTKRNRQIRPDFPILILSGDRDPVGNYTRGVWKTATTYKKVGLENVTTMFFANGRHELLHEDNRQEVFDLLTKWLEAIKENEEA
ncbi:alpha/beta fold hydrolase [Virgibacillus salexigens]|uniref:Monoglyceride lipase n=1 Tax=Virgibacillus massiliensis TaxID=1462526 RepID=A0A024QA73_9BACI|nr:alpha/beta hydrolase [Virgibacillus massiliensis]CDQ39105.1 monoglyceride lipase [Virgibacillus massiliensis]